MHNNVGFLAVDFNVLTGVVYSVCQKLFCDSWVKTLNVKDGKDVIGFVWDVFEPFYD